MIRNLLARVFRGSTGSRRVSASPIRTRRIAIEPLETRRLLAVTGSISGFALLPNGAGFPGLTVQLDSVDSQGNLSSVSGVGPTQTASDGSYSFSGLAAGNYEVVVSPSSKISMGTPSPGSAGGTDSSNEIQLTLASNQVATDYNFSVLGAQTDEISLRMFLSSTGSLGQFLTSLHTAPSVATGASGSPGTYTTGGSGLAVAASATITAPDSPTLTSMSVTIESPPDGSSESLAATTTGTNLTSSFAGDVLTVSGVADVSTYETVLQSVLYTDTAIPGTAGDRTLSITVNDGTDTSAPVTVTINVVEGTQVATTVTSVSPTSGPAGGGTVVTIDGTGFTSASTVDFGTTAATDVTDVSSTQLTATSPAGSVGVVDVTVTTSVETSATSSSDQFTYLPSVTSISPTSGPVGGGTVVTINGSGFTSASTVDFGTTAATDVTDVSATQLTATAPAGTVGAVDITVTTSGETSATSSSDQFNYLPTVTNLSATSGPASGGTLVTISGSGFTSASTVDFGTTAATDITGVSATQLTVTAPAGAGLVDVTVTTSGDKSATSVSDQFNYLPSVTSLSTTSGPASGGTVVTIDGTGFTSASTVEFGTTAATSTTFVSATQLTATAPAGTVGTVNVSVTTAGETSASAAGDLFTYVPSVTSVTPTSGASGGGTVVTIDGSGFTSASTVNFGSTAATNVTFVSATQLTATSPAGTGVVDVTVITASETSATSASDHFSYLPGVTSVSPNTGSASGGTAVTIDGSGFTSASTVDFGTAAATNVVDVSATEITATAPAGAGVVDVTVTTSGETSATSASDQFTYVPSVSSLSVSSGPAIGGTVVTIDGSGFTSASTVKFGTIGAASVTFDSATQITATAPAGAGTVDVTVTTAGETSATSASDQFTFVSSVTSLGTSSGPASGGTVVTINGAGFTSTSTVKFGTTAATNVTFDSATELTATAPAGAGVVDVTVTTAGETSATSASDQFTYLPSVTSVSASSGPAIGGTVVTIDGSGFTSASTVKFGTAAATSVAFDSATELTATAPAGAGVVDVTVTTAGETSATSASDHFTYLPSVTSVSPGSGPAGGGTVVTIDGSGFTGASTVDFGTAAATNVTLVSATQLTATAPAGSGVVDVTVTTSGETSATSAADQFTYALSVASVSPSSGPASGGTVVTIDGSGFTAASTVDFGTTPATSVTFVSATQLTAAAPAATAGTIDITVTTAGVTSATSPSDQFTYQPSVTGLSATSGSASGGIVVTINGSGFTAASTVDFGTTAATNVTFDTPTQITATAPAGTGVVDVTVTTSGETSATSSSDQFTYIPTVTGVSPSSGPASGGNVVTIDGSGFSAASTVMFGTTAATGVTYVSATQIEATAPATAPAGTVGPVDITVITAGETSATSPSDRYTYLPSVTSLSVDSGPASGGTVVIINGSGFSPESGVEFGTNLAGVATNVIFDSATQITATAPAGTVGTVNVTVTTSFETSAASAGDQFTYLPTVTSVSPNSGTADGGSVVTIDGSGFTAASTVNFGTAPATDVTLVSDTELTVTAPAGAGAVDATVTTSGETSATSSSDQFTYVPEVTSVSTTSGPASGGTVVTINGTGFTAASTIAFGTNAATGVTFVSATQLTATVPAGTVGTVDITVTTSGETSATSLSDQFTYLPSVTSASPSSGPVSGGTVVTIDGSGFTAASTVEFGTSAAASVTFVSDTEIMATAPAGSLGPVDITVTTSGETSATSSSDQFTYLPSVTGVSPNSGPANGGTIVTLDGSGFTAASTVSFGTAPATGVTFVSATQLTATAPAGAGIVDITATTSGETSATSSSDQFSYLPAVTSVSPNSGSASGGNVVTIDGSGFMAASTVEFGTNPATNVTYVSATQITATAPAGTVGPVDITVTTAGETSATSSSDQFIYLPSVTSASPSSGPVDGGTVVTIDGSGFTAASTVEFGTSAATGVTFVSATQIMATAPAASLGPVDITVTTSGETSASSSSDQFTYLPSVTSVSPSSGTADGGTVVTIDGSGFTAASTVAFGANAATGVTFVSDTQLTATAPAGTGIADVTVTTSGETSATSSSDQFSYVPNVTSVTADSGPASGGTVVTIDGSGFTAASTVEFGTTPATNVTFVSATQLTATAPAGSVGPADITVTTSGEASATSSSDQFTYLPSISSVSPTSGPAGGGTIVTIDGSGFTASTTVQFGSTAASGGTLVSPTEITVTAPAGTVGAVDITVTTSGETSFTSSSDQFSYLPSVASLSVNSGPVTGGTVVTITGSGFTAASTVEFGSNAASNVTFVSPTQLTATAPAGTGTVDITVTSSGATSPTSASDQFSYGASITADQAELGAGNYTAAGFTISGGVSGETYSYTITSSGGSIPAPVTGTGAVTASTQDVTGINVALLPAGTLTYTVTLSNNPGTSLTATALLYTTITVTSTPAATATVGQVYTYTVQTDAPAGDTVTVTPGASLPAGMTFDGVDTFTWTPAAGQEGTAPSFSATITDSLGNSTPFGPVFVEVLAANGLNVIAPPPSIAVGSPVLVGFNSTDSGSPTFTVTASSASDPTGSDLTATLMPQTNQVLQIVTSLGTMDFQLLNNYTPNSVSHLVSLIDSGAYATGATFYRIVQDFVDQGGIGGSSSSASTIPVELNSNLRFTSSGLLSFANDGVDGNGSEFFITNPDDMSDGFLDFRYTIFGKLISGDNVRQTLAATPVTTNTATSEDSQPIVVPKILSMSVTTETDAGVFMLQAASGATGPYTVTVSDGLGDTQTFTINVGANPYDPPNPWVAPVNGSDTLTTPANTPVTFTPQGESANGASVQVNVQLFEPVPSVAGAYVDSSYNGTNPPADTTNPYVSLSQNGSSYTVTPDNGFYGVQVLEVTGQAATAASWDSSSRVDPVYRAYVPVFVDPPAPAIASITAGGQTVTGTTPANNSTPGTELSFNVTGAVAGATVSVYMDGGATPIATGTVPSGATTITVTTDGSTTISAASHMFTVEQSIATPAIELYADWAVGSQGLAPGAEFPIPANTVVSPASAGSTLTITMPVAPSGYSITPNPAVIDAGQATSAGFTFADATPGTTYNFTITSSGNSGATQVTGSGSVTSASQQVTGIDVSSLPDGTLTFSVTLTDAFDDVGPAVTTTATLDA